MGYVRSRKAGGDRRQFHKLVGVGKAAGVVVESRGQGDGALLEAFGRQRPHRFHLFGGRGAVLESDHFRSYAPVRDHGRHVAGGRSVEFGKELADARPAPAAAQLAADSGPIAVHLLDVFVGQGRVTDAVKADEVGCDPLVDLWHVVRLCKRLEIGVSMNVDESRTDDAPAGIDFTGGRSLETADKLDAVARYGDVAAEPRRAGAVHDASITNDKVDAGQLNHPFRRRARRRPTRVPVPA